jgi:hypothetical protein
MNLTEVFAELDTVIRDATPEERPRLVVQLSARLAALGAGMATPAKGQESKEQPDLNLDVTEAAKQLGLSESYLYQHSRELPFAIKHGRRLLFSSRGLERWNRQRMGGSNRDQNTS